MIYFAIDKAKYLTSSLEQITPIFSLKLKLLSNSFCKKIWKHRGNLHKWKKLKINKIWCSGKKQNENMKIKDLEATSYS